MFVKIKHILHAILNLGTSVLLLIRWLTVTRLKEVCSLLQMTPVLFWCGVEVSSLIYSRP